MRVVFRTDASLHIGTGHVMRCLTLADALRDAGARCEFVCRPHPGHLIGLVKSKGYTVHTLPAGQGADTDLAHSHWLGATQAEDAAACAAIVSAARPDWLVVDHYALDARWERPLLAHCQRLMVIDDLADREHACAVLLDQTFGRHAADYRALVPEPCVLLCGAQYALLRPEFAALRPYSLARRAHPQLRQILVALGGVDKDHYTGKVLSALKACRLPADCALTVVLGPSAPWLEKVREQAQAMPWPTRVCVGVSNMAQIMADSDLAIGAAGSSAWERCCLGLPTLLCVLAENQALIAQALAEQGAIQPLGAHTQMSAQMERFFSSDDLPQRLAAMSAAASAVVGGAGAHIVDEFLRR